MRCTQVIGLRSEASEFLIYNCNRIPNVVCPHCGKTVTSKYHKEAYQDESGLGMCDDGPVLNKYYLKNGACVKEVVQEVVWSSGPCIFLCLEDDSGQKMFEWSRKDINEC